MDQPPLPVRVVTGANRGIGLEIAKALAATGRVLVVGRTQATADAARSAVLAAHPNAKVEALAADFGSLSEVRLLGKRVRDRWDRLDAVVHNAAVIAPERQESVDGIELQLQVNHLAPFLLTGLLREPLERSAGRVVVVASEAHRRAKLDLGDLEFDQRRYSAGAAYSQSKLANVLFSHRLAELWAGRVAVNAIHPGVVSTPLLGRLFGPLFPLRFLFRSVNAGAAPVARLAIDPSLTGKSGLYFRRFKEVASSDRSHDASLQIGLWEASTAYVGDVYGAN